MLTTNGSRQLVVIVDITRYTGKVAEVTGGVDDGRRRQRTGGRRCFIAEGGGVSGGGSVTAVSGAGLVAMKGADTFGRDATVLD